MDQVVTVKNTNNKGFYIFSGIMAASGLAFCAGHWPNEGGTFVDNALLMMEDIRNSPLSLHWSAESAETFLLLGLVMGGAAVYRHYDKLIKTTNMKGIEHGSAYWNKFDDKFYKRFADCYKKGFKLHHDGEQNMLLSERFVLCMDGHKTMRNNNILVIGGSGTGKSRFFIKPNVLQANCSMVITDPKGELLESLGHFLAIKGYKIKVLNLANMKQSYHYNPFEYIRGEEDVLKLVKCLIANTNNGKGGGDPFWEASEQLLLQAIIFYLIKYRPKEDHNFATVCRLLRAMEVNENDPSFENGLDLMFKEVRKREPDSVAVKYYDFFKKSAGKTAKSIIISCAVRIQVFNMHVVEQMTNDDDLELGKIGDEKTALFAIIPSADSTYNFIVSMMYTQLFETLYYHAEYECDGRHLPIPVRFLLDEFANIGTIPEFDKKVATMRQYLISVSIVLQNQAQLEVMYDKAAKTIMGNCDTTLFLGSSESETCKMISDMLGTMNVKTRSTSESKGSKGSTSHGYNTVQRPLMTPDEVATMNETPDNEDGKHDKCIIFLRGMHPFFDTKYPYQDHPNYEYTGDADKGNRYVNNIDQIYKMKQHTSDLELRSQQYSKKARTYEEQFNGGKRNTITTFAEVVRRNRIMADDVGEGRRYVRVDSDINPEGLVARQRQLLTGITESDDSVANKNPERSDQTEEKITSVAKPSEAGKAEYVDVNAITEKAIEEIKSRHKIREDNGRLYVWIQLNDLYDEKLMLSPTEQAVVGNKIAEYFNASAFVGCIKKDDEDKIAIYVHNRNEHINQLLEYIKEHRRLQQYELKVSMRTEFPGIAMMTCNTGQQNIIEILVTSIMNQTV